MGRLGAGERRPGCVLARRGGARRRTSGVDSVAQSWPLVFFRPSALLVAARIVLAVDQPIRERTAVIAGGTDALIALGPRFKPIEARTIRIANVLRGLCLSLCLGERGTERGDGGF